MKNKMYSKLYKFANIKSWQRDDSTTFISKFYEKYKLEYKITDLFWNYKVQRSINDYNRETLHEGIVTLNVGGKILFTVVVSVVLSLIIWLGYHINDYKIYISIVTGSYLLSFFIFSIFNWSIYRTLRKVNYNIKNAKKIKEKEEQELLNQEIIITVNKTIAKDPRLARKIKLNQLNKKRNFWKKFRFFNNEEEIEEEK